MAGKYPEEGLASWYSSKTTSTGEGFSDDYFSCAMRRVDFGKCYQVCNMENNKCVVVRHNDFGPAKNYFKRGRIIDLTKTAFSQIASLEEGLVKVKVNEY
ncbi:MAG: septal ring lytic transglycosylase RlpA family protein [Candidatus Omnitrophica bacterium]|nr:septal ring lytic transglycosylase RlpA family protein [Candidatus Omnitrophota bacterium]